MTEYQGCTDGGCLLRVIPLRQHTNGGCRCLQDVPGPLQRAIKRKLWHLRRENSQMRDELKKQWSASGVVFDESLFNRLSGGA